MCAEHRPPPSRGFTLIELIVVIVVLAAGLVGLLAVFNQAVARSADPMLQQQALALAEGYMEEIMGTRCPGTSTAGSSRGAWAHALDYHALDQQPPRDIAGNGLAGLDDYRVQVEVADASLNGVPACRISVAVSAPQGIRIELSSHIAHDAD